MFIDIAKYNIVRRALGESTDDPKDLEIIEIKPRKFPLKKDHDETVLKAAMEILDDPGIMTGLTPLDTLQSLAAQDGERPEPEVILYVMVCYAVAVQQGWIKFSTILNKYIINQDNKMALEYAQDMHKRFFKGEVH